MNLDVAVLMVGEYFFTMRFKKNEASSENEAKDSD